MSLPTTSHNAHRDPSGEFSSFIAYPARFKIPPKERVKNVAFIMLQHEQDIEACLKVTNLRYCSEGGFGKVYVGLDKQDRKLEYAVKIVQATYTGPNYLAYWRARVKSEISFLKNLHHPNILKYVDHCWLDGDDKIDRSYLALKTEYLDKTLQAHLNGAPMEYGEFKRFFTQISSALVYMHDLGVAHHDIKGGNIMINCKKDWKILDFGHAHFYAGPKEQALEEHFFLGTLLYNCPCKRAKVPYNPFPSDSYALGMTLWRCIIGFGNVFCDKNDKEYAQKIRAAWEIINETVWPKLEEDGEIGPHHLVARMLVAPLEERLFVSEALELFEREDALINV